MKTRLAAFAAVTVCLLAGVAVVPVLCPGTRAAAGDAVTDLAARVDALEREVVRLRAAAVSDGVSALRDLEIPDALDLCGTPLPMKRPEVREAIAYELVLSIGKPTMPLLWMRRAPIVLPQIESRLRARGLPDDLKYVAMVESDLRWTPESPAGAVGLWQFMSPTGRRFGLRIDRFFDDRMDPDRATEAALDLLGQLRARFGDWNLALAAYNAGEGTVQRALSDQGKRDYFDLYLPYETRRYVPRLAAAKLIFTDPERYGLFRMEPLYRPEYRSVEIDVKEPAGDLRRAARAAGLDYAALRVHNPNLRGNSLPPGRHRMRVPAAPSPR